jgi:hypothetical protein
MLDNVDLEENVKLGEFEIRYLNSDELRKILRFKKNAVLSAADKERLLTYEKFPWASVEKEISQKDAEDSTRRILVSLNLAWAHAGIMNWWPFTELIRTLNLTNPSLGPVICRHFYHIPFANLEIYEDIEKVIYAEPAVNIIDDERGTMIEPMLLGYTINQELASDFMSVRIILDRCLSENNSQDNSHICTAVHHFENGDRNLVPYPIEGSFNAIDPLMSYEAALESMVIHEDERGIENKLASRIASLFSDKAKEVENFIRKVFWLRSKVAHGGRPIEEIEQLIIRRPNDGINDKTRNKQIEAGHYDNLLLCGGFFPGFLVNLREITRFVIRFFCHEFESGYSKEKTIKKLKT